MIRTKTWKIWWRLTLFVYIPWIYDESNHIFTANFINKINNFFFDSLLLCNLFIIGFNKKRKVFSWNRFVFLIFELVHLQMAFCWDSHINIVCATESWDQTKFRCPLWVMNNNNRLVSCRSFFFNSIFA